MMLPRSAGLDDLALSSSTFLELHRWTLPKSNIYVFAWQALWLQISIAGVIISTWTSIMSDPILTFFRESHIVDFILAAVVGESILRALLTLLKRGRFIYTSFIEAVLLGGVALVVQYFPDQEWCRYLIIIRSLFAVYYISYTFRDLPESTHPLSSNKKRFRAPGFDLDLSYITRKMIAMADPQDGASGNRISSLVSMLDSRHRGRFFIYNVSSGVSLYDPVIFNNRTAFFPIADASVPTLRDMLVFCQNVGRFLTENPDNVAVVHSHEGVGRTGLMICAWLMYTSQCSRVIDAIRFFGSRRTDPNIPGRMQTVRLPSQLRYLQMFRRLLMQYPHPDVSILDSPPSVTLTSIVVENPMIAVSRRTRNKVGLWITISESGCSGSEPSTKRLCEMIDRDCRDEPLLINCCGIQLRGDICFKMYAEAERNELISSFWIHSMFLDRRGSMSVSAQQMELGSLSKGATAFLIRVNYQFLGDSDGGQMNVATLDFATYNSSRSSSSSSSSTETIKLALDARGGDSTRVS